MVVISDRLKALGACAPSVEWSRQFGSDYRAFYQAIPSGDWVLWYAMNGGIPRQKVVKAIVECIRYILENTSEPNVIITQILGDLENWNGSNDSLDILVKDRIRLVKQAFSSKKREPALYANIYASLYYTLEYVSKGTSPIDAMFELYEAALFRRTSNNEITEEIFSFIENVPLEMAKIVRNVIPFEDYGGEHHA